MMTDQHHRQSIRQTSTPTNLRISPQWKNALKQKCLERAREKRDQQIALKRQFSPASSDVSPSNVNNWEYAVGVSNPYLQSNESVRDMIQDQVEATGVTVLSSTQLEDHKDGVDANFCTPVRRTLDHDTNHATLASRRHFSFFESEMQIHDGTYITEEELFALMNEIEDEIRHEEELFLAEQMEQLQQEEKISQLLMEEQIQSFESTLSCVGGDDHTVSCPLCHSGALALDASSGMIFCQERNRYHGKSVSNCKLVQGACFGDGMTLEKLKEMLIQAYEEHSKFCWGMLQFDLSKSHGKCGLIVMCAQCSLGNVLVPVYYPIQKQQQQRR